jgi:hypothetical protein
MRRLWSSFLVEPGGSLPPFLPLGGSVAHVLHYQSVLSSRAQYEP